LACIDALYERTSKFQHRTGLGVSTLKQCIEFNTEHDMEFNIGYGRELNIGLVTEFNIEPYLAI
jgi:hypothetical protein